MQHVAPNNVAICCDEMLRSFAGLELANVGPTMLYVAIVCLVGLYSVVMLR